MYLIFYQVIKYQNNKFYIQLNCMINLCILCQFFNFIQMAHLYRQHRSQTHRHISNNLPNNFEQFNNNHVTSYGIQPKLNTKLQQQNSDIPLAYYFDKSQKRKIIKDMIQSYFQQTNPQSIKLRSKAYDKKYNHTYHQKEKTISSSKKNLKAETLSKSILIQDLNIKQMSKTVAPKFFSHRSFVQTADSNLPIIAEVHQHNSEKRPQSEQKVRYFSQTPMKRRQSAGVSPRKQIISLNQSQISNKSDKIANSEYDFEENLSLSKVISVASRNSGSSQKSFMKNCKYYSFKYSDAKIVKSFNTQGLFLLSRQAKLRKYGAETLWHTNPNLNELILDKHQPLSKYLYRKVTKLNGQETIQLIYINQEAYNGLFKNNSQWLRDIIISICQQMIKLKDKIVINKITLDNICRLGQKQIRIIDWSGASLKQQIINLDKNKVTKITQPQLKQQNEQQNSIFKWICQPQYLAPQLIQLLAVDRLKDQNLWKASISSDIWSLGCLIFEILTLIPLNAKERHSIKGRSYFRKGIFHMSQFSYLELERKQRLFSTQALRIVKKQCSDLINQCDSRILQVMSKMLIYAKQKRISPEQVIMILSK